METMHVDMFSCCFFAMRTKYKKEYKLLNEDQASYFFECMFIMAIQIILFTCLEIDYWTETHDPKKQNKGGYINDFTLQLVLFFCTFILHAYMLATIRNGIQICKFVLENPSEFANPHAAYFLGMSSILVNIACSILNLQFTLFQDPSTDPKDIITSAISRFVNFKLLMQVQDYYMRQRANFEIKNAVSKDPLVFSTDPPKQIGCLNKSLKYFYKFVRMIYHAVYFYFFPLFILVVPFCHLITSNDSIK